MNDELKNLAEQKEKEWRDIQEKRIEILEKTLKQKSQDYNDEKTKFTRLKDDFKYNLKLLEERDAELEKYAITKDGKVFQKAFLNYPDREIGELNEQDKTIEIYQENFNKYKILHHKTENNTTLF